MYALGDIIDIGGRWFFADAKRWIPDFKSYTCVELSSENAPEFKDPRFKLHVGDGCAMPEVPSNFFDTVLNVQVLEHVFAPQEMLSEMYRVMKPGGYGIVMVPQTGSLHCAPHHYYNFTRFWLEKACRVAGFEIVEWKPLGGFWSTVASRMVYFFLHAFRVRGFSDPEVKRNLFFYLLFPFMVASTVVIFPICLVMSLGDLQEEPNNHLAVIKKP